jgi:hypothetical protein
MHGVFVGTVTAATTTRIMIFACSDQLPYVADALHILGTAAPAGF